MVWFRRWKAQLTWHKVSEFANLLIFMGILALIFGLVLSPVVGWSGLGTFVLGLVVLMWSDSFLPDYDKKEGKE